MERIGRFPQSARAFRPQAGLGDTLADFRHFLRAWWEQVGLQALLAPVERANQPGVTLRTIDRPADVARVNPFAPILTQNGAAAIGPFIEAYPAGVLAAILRPCEWRTYAEMQKRGHLPLIGPRYGSLTTRLISICVDCPGTLAAADYQERALALGQAALLRQVVDQAQAGHSTTGCRLACQLCSTPALTAADITIGLFGAAPAGQFLIFARDPAVAARLRLAEVVGAPVGPEAVDQRDAAVRALISARQVDLDWRNGRKAEGFGDLLAWSTCCTLCTDCLDACPLYRGELAGLLSVGGTSDRGRPTLSVLVGVSRWLASCSGCGLCQEACERGVPLTLLFNALSRQIQSGLNYVPGDPDRSLPWTCRQPLPHRHKEGE